MIVDILKIILFQECNFERNVVIQLLKTYVMKNEQID